MIRYVILIWNKLTMSDVRVLINPSNGESRTFEDQQSAEIHARARTVNCNYRVVDIPVLEEE